MKVPPNPLLRTYMAFVAETCKHDEVETATHELTAEAGEVAGVVAKAIRRGEAIDPNRILDEVGDVLWGCQAVLQLAGWGMDDALLNNMHKLRERMKANDGQVR